MRAVTSPIALQHDGTVWLAVGNRRTDKLWRNQQRYWSELLSQLNTPHVSQETLAEYLNLPKDDQARLKDVGGYVGGMLTENGERKLERLQNRSFLTLDADHADDTLLFTLNRLFPFAWALHSTRKHSASEPRYRVLIPFDRPVTPEEYPALSRLLAYDLGIEHFDGTTHEVNRLMYWPSRCSDGEYVFKYYDAPWLMVDASLARYQNWADQSQWPYSKKELEDLELDLGRTKFVEDPHAKTTIIGAFCRVYDIHQAISTFLPTIYQPGVHVNRYTYKGGSTSEGLVVYEDTFAKSYHETDPARGGIKNAYDLVRTHLFGHLDESARASTAWDKLPSQQAMREFANARSEVVANHFDFVRAQAAEDFDDELDDSWRGLLSITDKGALKPSIENYRLILEHDPALRGRVHFNEFLNAPVLRSSVPWRAIKADEWRDGSEWTDRDQIALHHYIEANYFTRPSRLEASEALSIVMHDHRFHPIRDYLHGLTWDGTPRLDTALIRYLGAEDTDYTRAVTRKFFVGAVARVMRPGIKFDHMLLVTGDQGIGKSQFVRIMANGWGSDSFTTVQGKEGYEQLRKAWLVEVAELSATRRADVEAVKHFVSMQVDRYRPPYERYVQTFPRQCVFFGTTNDERPLSDPTGNRRFWTVGASPMWPVAQWADELETVRDQLWAEAFLYWQCGESMYLSERLESVARQVQDRYTFADDLEEEIERWLDKPIPATWYQLTRAEQLHTGDFNPVESTHLRDRVCAKEVWLQCLKQTSVAMESRDSRRINTALGRVARRRGWAAKGTLRFASDWRTRGWAQC